MSTNTEETNMNTNPNSSIPEGVQTLALDMARSYRTANSDEDRIKTDAHMSALIATVRRYGANHDDLMELGRKMHELSGPIEVLQPVTN